MRWLQRSTITSQSRGRETLVLPNAERFATDDLHNEVVALCDLNHDRMAMAGPLYQLLLEADGLFSASPTAEDMFAQAADAGYHVQLIRDEIDQIDVDPEARILFLPDAGLEAAAIIRSPYFRNAFMLALIKGLRAIDQIERGVVPFTLRPDQALMFGRAMAADQNAIRTLVAYELKNEDPSLWRHILGSNIGDIALRFTQVIENARPNELDEQLLVALRGAFLSWYRDIARVNAHDHQALERLDNDLMSTRNRLLMRAIMLPGYLDNLCQIDDDVTYADTILHDALISHDSNNLPDPINTAHLHHIMLDLDVTLVNNVSFRDSKLARMIFPA